MRVIGCIWIVGLAGCSTAPLAGTMDCLFPSRPEIREPRPDLGRLGSPDRQPVRDRDDDWLDIPELTPRSRSHGLPLPP